MQLAPTTIATASATTPAIALAPIGSPFDDKLQRVATGHWIAPHGAPRSIASWWTVGANLAPAGGWISREAALDGARLLSTKVGPIAVTTAYGSASDGANRLRYYAHRLATGEPSTQDSGWSREPTQWLTGDMLRAPQFRGYTLTNFALIDIFDRGEPVRIATGSA